MKDKRDHREARSGRDVDDDCDEFWHGKEMHPRCLLRVT